jgi:[protein-PII] uridylyltransferase
MTAVTTPFRVLESARQTLSAQAGRGEAGRVALERFADRLDALIRQLAAEAPPPGREFAVLALGGYGRRQVCLHSDIDLLVLFDGPIGAACEQFLRAFLNPLWDLQLVVGHQVREVADFAVLETDNPTFLLALVDGRTIAGDHALADRVMAKLQTAEARRFMLRSLWDLIEERHRTFNDTLYQLEPDVKDAPGSLRDLTALEIIARLSDPTMSHRGPTDKAALNEAQNFLLRVRSILHLESGRNQNVLTHDLQEKSSETLRYVGTDAGGRVEQLMSDYFRHARGVNRALEWARKNAPDPIGTNLVRSRDGLRFTDPDRTADRPARWLTVFQAALDTESPVADETLAMMRQQVRRYVAEDFFPTPADRAALLKFLRPHPGLYARLSEMHDSGVLGAMFPEFAAIASRVVRDFYHKFTVDEHTLLTIRNLERLASAPGRQRFGGLLADLAQPELLVLALLYHDVGKWRNDDHVDESVRLARQMLERLRLPTEAANQIEFLIKNHLQMSHAAFRRDTEDPDVVRQFAEIVGVEEQLKMLCLMTLVDIEAVAPGTLTPWREELLWQLYVDTYNRLTLQYGDELIDRNLSGLSELLAGRPSTISEEEIARFVEGLPRRYLRLFAPDAIYGHVLMSRDVQPQHVHAALERKGAAWEVTVVTLDQPFLFSNLCGVLSSFGMDILRGHAMTNPNGLVFDTFQFTDRYHFLELNADGRDHLLAGLEGVVSGTFDVTARLRAREQGILNRRSEAARVAPVVHFDGQASRRYTILDIVAGNSLGLLNRISRVISRHGCDVDLVLIATEGERAIDVFHITKQGAKLTDADESALTADLVPMLEGRDEAD